MSNSKINYYPGSTASTPGRSPRAESPSGIYSSSSMRTEASIRQELINTLDGHFPEIAKGATVLLRRMRRDSNNNLIECPCRDNVTKEPDKNNFCPICYGMGYYFDESYMTSYKILEGANDTANTLLNKRLTPGMINTDTATFYVKYSRQIDIDDRVVEVSLDSEGYIITPLKRTLVYRVNYPRIYRADNGRIEYWKLFCHKEEVRFLNPPSNQ